MREHRFKLTSIALSAEMLVGFDCVALVTNHGAFDYELIARYTRLLIDAGPLPGFTAERGAGVKRVQGHSSR